MIVAPTSEKKRGFHDAFKFHHNFEASRIISKMKVIKRNQIEILNT
jgi:hypothetical protein